MLLASLSQFLRECVNFPGLNGERIWSAIQHAPVFWVDSLTELHDYRALVTETTPTPTPYIVVTPAPHGLSVFAVVESAAVGIQNILHTQLSYVPRHVVFEWLIQANQILMMNYLECSKEYNAVASDKSHAVVVSIIGSVPEHVLETVRSSQEFQRMWCFQLLPVLQHRMLAHAENIGREFGGETPVWKVTLNGQSSSAYH